LKEGYHFWTPSLTGKMDPLPKLFVTRRKSICYGAFEKPTSKNRKTVMISLLGSEELKTYPLNYMTAVIDTIADNNDVNILLIIFQSKSMMLKLF
jgi:heptosyltransferase-2